MAIDTKEKRSSALRFALPWMIFLLPPAPDNDVDEGDRAHVSGFYRDFDFDEPGPSTSRAGRWYAIGVLGS